MAKIYWRTIKRGIRSFADLPNNKIKEQVKALALQEVAEGTISAEQYKELINEDYPVVEESTEVVEDSSDVE